MTTIILMFIFPIGMVFFYHERKNRGKYLAVFDDYMQKVSEDTTLGDKEKIAQVRELFIANRYEVVSMSDKEIIGERKILSMGLLMMGLLLYVLYFFFLQKPHTIVYKVK